MSTALLSPRAEEALKALEEGHGKQKLWCRDAVRLRTALQLCLAMACNGLMRGSMSLAMVCMVAPSMTMGNESVSVASESTLLEDVATEKTTFMNDNRKYQVNWSSEEQARVHTAFYVGAFIAILLTDYVMKRLDPKIVLSLSLLLNVIGSMFTPVAVVLLGDHLVVAAIRLVMGFGSGLIAPCGLFIISKWFPMTEKSTAVAIFTTGNQIGIALSMVLTAKICQLDFAGGWPSGFVVYGLLTAAYVLLWQVRGSSRPRSSKYITATELEYITGKKGLKSRTKSIILGTPWRKILLSPCVFAICVNSFAQSFVLIGLVTYLPKFNQEALNMDVDTNGLWCSVPFFVQMVTKMLFGLWADAIKKRGVSPTLVTWVFNGIATFASAGCIFVAPLLAPLSSTLSMLSVILAMALFGAFVPGYNTAIVCVAPQFTATISSYQQLYSQVGSALAPFLIGIMTTNGTLEEWRVVYMLLAVVLGVAGVFYQIWGHGRSEAWGHPEGSRLPSITIEVGEDETKKSEMKTSLTVIEAHNALLAAEPDPPSKRLSRVSYKECELNIPDTISELENDVVYEDEEEETDFGRKGSVNGYPLGM